MSQNTDTRCTDFEAWAIRENYAFYSESERSVLFYGVSGTRNAIQKAWDAGMSQAATEAAKATGTAGELPPLPIYYGTSAMEAERAHKYATEYGQACAEAARQPAPVVAVTRIDTGYGNYLEFERKTTGKSGWLVRTESGDLVRALNPTEVLLVDSALAATAAPVLSDVQIDHAAIVTRLGDVLKDLAAGGTLRAAKAGVQSVINDISSALQRAESAATRGQP